MSLLSFVETWTFSGKCHIGRNHTLVVWTVSSKEIFRKDPSSGFSVDRSIDSILSEIYQKWNITKLLNILIQSNLFKRSNFQVISQFIHVKDISKVNDNGN